MKIDSYVSGMIKLAILALFLTSLNQTNYAAYAALTVTPYDRQMKPIHGILNQKAKSKNQVKYDEVMKWMKKIRNLGYSRSQEWRTPEQTVKRQSGDCKDKALLLLSYFKEKGCVDVRLVIGKKNKKSRETHAWVQWKHKGEWITLDPTYNRRPISKQRGGEYLQKYVYMGNKKYVYIPNDILVVGL